ncbi:MAG: hypothetical protein HY775_00865 [Acidobacteria bacterium]|nr:hypothetical protein [Acidobacteriota bacterium]
MATRKVQLYLTEEQYRFLKDRAGTRGSIAGVVRDLVDAAAYPDDPTADPLYRFLTEPARVAGGPAFAAEKAKRDLHRRPR